MALPQGSVNPTCEPSGVAAMLGQNVEACLMRPTVAWEAVSITTVSGVNEEHTYAYLPSGEKMIIPGPLGTCGVVQRIAVCWRAPTGR